MSQLYDVTHFLVDHPGGDQILLEYAGAVDASMVFELSYHSATAREMMTQWLVWDPTPYVGRQGTLMLLVKGAGGDDGNGRIDHRRIRREDRLVPDVVQVLESIQFT